MATKTHKKRGTPEILYYYRGALEVVGKHGTYQWTSGYSPTSGDGNVLYPFITRRAAQRDALAQGCVARFEEHNRHRSKGA